MSPYSPNPPSKIRYTLIMAAKIFFYLITAAQAAMENIHHKEPVAFRFRCWWGLSPRLGAVAQVLQCSGHSKGTLRALGLSPNKGHILLVQRPTRRSSVLSISHSPGLFLTPKPDVDSVWSTPGHAHKPNSSLVRMFCIHLSQLPSYRLLWETEPFLVLIH